jgi:general secretion pathway protein K
MTRSRGAAVVLAMLIAALAAAVAATVFADQERWNRIVFNRRDQVQAQALVMAGIQWARQILQDDARRSAIDHLGEPWALSLPPIPLDNGEIRGSIVDAQGRLNINALGHQEAAQDFERMRITALFAQRGGPTVATDAIADWIDADGNVRGGGAEDAFYAAQAVPGLAANAPLLRVAELSMVKGVTPQALAAVIPYLSALPDGTPTNVNTAPPEVLAAIVDNLTSDGLTALLAARAQKPFQSVADFRGRLPSGASLAADVALSVSSDYFYVTVEARQGVTVARGRALVHRVRGQAPAIAWEVVE